MKNRKTKFYEYEEKYAHIPDDYNERLVWMCEKYNLSDKKKEEILLKKYDIMNSIEYNTIKVVLFEIPEGSPRPRFRLVNRYNLANAAASNSQFVHVYSITGKEDNMYMERLISNGELSQLNQIIYTPCDVEYNAFLPTPSTYNITDTFLAEIGLIRPLVKPDWDNVGKKYSDMFNENIWLDDTLVIDGTVRRYYSIKPRVEVYLKFTNMLYNKHQYNSIKQRLARLGLDNIEPEYFGN